MKEIACLDNFAEWKAALESATGRKLDLDAVVDYPMELSFTKSTAACLEFMGVRVTEYCGSADLYCEFSLLSVCLWMFEMTEYLK